MSFRERPTRGVVSCWNDDLQLVAYRMVYQYSIFRYSRFPPLNSVKRRISFVDQSTSRLHVTLDWTEPPPPSSFQTFSCNSVFFDSKLCTMMLISCSASVSQFVFVQCHKRPLGFNFGPPDTISELTAWADSFDATNLRNPSAPCALSDVIVLRKGCKFN